MTALSGGGLTSISEEPNTNNQFDSQNYYGNNTDKIYQNHRDLITLLDKKEFSDVTLLVDNQQIYAHQVILASRSTYFEALFTHDFSEKDKRVVDFNDSGITYSQLFQLLKHIYSDNMKIDSKFI